MVAGAMAGSMFGRYEMRGLLGVGGMGEVYEAYDTSKNRVVAVKVLNRELAADPVFVQRFRRESQAMASVQEPHVIPVHDWGEIDGVLYIDMRLVKGTDLKDRLQRHGRLTPGEAVQVIEQIAAALDAAHQTRLVHRDVKPANILLTSNLFAYLVDFGIAHTATDPALTSTGSAVGSMAYMAPERFDEAPLTGAVDTYALTCVLYESLVGRVPYPVNSLAGAIGSHQMAPPPRPSAVDPALSAFDVVIDRGMAKRPGERYATPGDLGRAARAALVQTERSAPSTVPGPRVSGPVTPVTAQPHWSEVPPPPTVSGPQILVDRTGAGQHGRPTTGPSHSSATVRQPAPDERPAHPSATVRQPAPGPAYPSATVRQPAPSGYTHPSAPLPLPPQRNTSTPLLAGALGALIVVAAVGVAVWVMLDVADDKQTVAGPSSTVGATLPPPVIETVSQDVPTTPYVPPPATTTLPPLQSSVSGADGQGFLTGPRCNDNDAAMSIARTTGSKVVICHTGAGRYYYKGARASDGLGLELDDPVPTGNGGFTATNPTDGTRYLLTATGLVIAKDGEVLASEPVTEFAYR
ncbi:serine/threonine protein kinase [Nocardia neocaledoniensis]|uniref:serine/threonine protein kinase n=1 Tax=Nocardia neocaledoniensis TaxID=236511 RepID=UPI002455F016|nr:serine/threonine protein kinase [Nocardia neocaledoniensis]